LNRTQQPGSRYVPLVAALGATVILEVQRPLVTLLRGLPGVAHAMARDLVISVDTSIAHLSGSMGMRTWILLPQNGDWRWLLERDDTPWYESLKLYRQHRLGDWSNVLTSLDQNLRGVFDLR